MGEALLFSFLWMIKSTKPLRTVGLMPNEGEEVKSKGGNFGDVMEGVASIALLPSGAISGHFIHRQNSISICYGLFGTELACEKECSRGEDYRLIKLEIIDYSNGTLPFYNAVGRRMLWIWLKNSMGRTSFLVSFNCETLKSDKAAEDHIKQFMPKLAGLDAIV
ncbi:hypothetical protein GBA52_029118 [Prunus armeniaca]|nr:hypothetical protein GBA52_029118 [Prunus armeniaca]